VRLREGGRSGTARMDDRERRSRRVGENLAVAGTARRRIASPCVAGTKRREVPKVLN
jgi:hypothetical protein